CLRVLLSAAAVAASMSCARFAVAQTSGSWIVDADGAWSAPANWSSDPAFPDAAGTATFGVLPTSTAGHVVTLDTNVTLDTIAFATPFKFTIGGAGGSITLVGAATINATDGPPNTAISFPVGHTIAVPIFGTVGLNKTGSAAIQLTGINTFTGGINIAGGALYVSENNDAALGDASNIVTLTNGAALANSGASAFNTSRAIVLGTGGGEFRNFAPMNLAGSISGAGDLVKRLANATLTLSGANTYTGQTFVRDDGVIALTGANGSIAGTTQINLAGGMVLDNLANANTDRVNAAAPIFSHGGSVHLVGHASTNIDEAVGTIALAGGTGLINIVGNSANTTLTAPDIDRVGRSTGLIRGDQLGGGTGPGFSNVFLTNAPTLTGGGGVAGSPTVSIVPWLFANNASGLTLNSSANTFITYDTNGFRPLNLNAEFDTTLGGVSTSNVRLVNSTVSNTPTTVNSLLLTGQNLSGPGTITIGSGAVLVSAIGGTYSAPLEFGAAEAIIHTSSTGTFTGVIGGTNGLTKGGVNTLNLRGANVYTGTTTILQGTVGVFDNVANDGVTPGPLGLSNSPIEMYSGQGGNYARLHAAGTANLAIDRPMDVISPSIDSVAAIGTAVGYSSTLSYNGTININGGALRFEGNPVTAMQINGAIHGTGRVLDAFGSKHVLGGNNHYTGGTTILAGTYLAGSDTAFGVGSIVFGNTTAPSAANLRPGSIGAFGAPRTLANSILIASVNPSPTNPNALGMVIIGSQPLTFSGPIDLGGSQRTISVFNSANTTFSGAISRGGIDKQGSGRLILSGANTYTGDTLVQSGTLSFGRTQSNTSLAIDGDGYAEVLPGGDKILVLRNLSIAGGSFPITSLDLADNDLKIANGSSATVAAQIASARNTGTWDGNGITSSAARDRIVRNTTLGTLNGSEFLAMNGVDAVFDDFSVSPSDVLVKYTYNGDTDFNGVVDFDDYSRIDGGFNNQLTGWVNGDFDYNGIVDFDDYSLIDFAFNTQDPQARGALSKWVHNGPEYSDNWAGNVGLMGGSQLVSVGSAARSGIFVPEPAIAGIFVLMASATVFRRRQKIPRDFPLCWETGCEYISRR
ncbi:MAG: autotransporter-associated beta strand repeat-containing protein, partial [Anaerolineae bacterium]|nr:autotransporter-associated beta strand repeat-containing protein [Phycisphaerae bacterium]